MTRFGNIDDLIAFDIEGSREGKPLDLGGGRVLWVRRAGGHNVALRYAAARVLEEMAAERDQARLDGDIEKLAELQDRSDHLCAARNLVARWEGFTGPGGEELECTPEALLELFELAPDVFRRVIEMAESEGEYRLAADTKSAPRRRKVGSDKRATDVDAARSEADGETPA